MTVPEIDRASVIEQERKAQIIAAREKERAALNDKKIRLQERVLASLSVQSGQLGQIRNFLREILVELKGTEFEA